MSDSLKPACQCRLEEITDQTAWETLKQFDGRLEGAAQSLMKDNWLEDLVAAGGSPPEILALPNSEPTQQVGGNVFGLTHFVSWSQVLGLQGMGG